MKLSTFSISLLVATFGCGLLGCGDSAAPDPKKEEVRLNNAVEMRKLFDKAGRDYSKLNAADKAAFDKLSSPTPGEQAFNEMKTGPSGSASTGPSQ